MSRPIPAGDDVEHFESELPHHRAWSQAVLERLVVLDQDLVSGATLNANGMGLRFSRWNFGRRWMMEPIGGGAYRYAPWGAAVAGQRARADAWTAPR